MSQWISTTARPDITCVVGVLARFTENPTKAVVKAARKIVRFLRDTALEGLFYSPESEERFNKKYREYLPEDRPFPAKTSFGDCSFASCFKTFRSSSGCICYVFSFPLIWKYGRQGVMAKSSCEGEYIAASDVIVLSESNNMTSFLDVEQAPRKVATPDEKGYVNPQEDEVIFCDSTSAIAISKNDTRPRSRHYALRYYRVKEASDRIFYVPTSKMKADGITKTMASTAQRNLILHHTEPSSQIVEEEEDDEDDEDVLFGSLIQGGEVYIVGIVV